MPCVVIVPGFWGMLEIMKGEVVKFLGVWQVEGTLYVLKSWTFERRFGKYK